MLTKKDKKKRYNKNAKSKGHSFAGTWTQLTRDAFTESPGSAISGVASAAAGAISTGIDAAKLQGVEEAQADIDKQAAFQSTASTQDDLLAEMTGAGNIKSDYSHKDFMQSGGDFAKSMVSGALQGAASGASAGPWGAVAGAAASLISGAIGRSAASAKAKVEVAEKNQAAKEANQAKAQALTAKAGALDQASDARALAAYAAEGGPINPSFSSNFPSPVTEFNTGGSHEENPYDGIPQGIAPDGLPNLVEEGEVKYDNYIFSDRLMLSKEDKKKYKFLKGKTYADAAKAIKKELGIDERPNDPIAKTDLEEQLNLLSTLQEKKRASKGLKGENRMMYEDGGHIFSGRKSTITSYMDEGFTRKEARQAYKLGVDPWDLYDPTLSDDNMEGKANKFGDSSSWLQAAPALGNAIGVLTQAFNKPDYKHAKELQQSNETFTPISYTPLTQRMTYKPMDVNYYGNKLGAQAGATRRAIREQTASNPYAATAALLTADANAQNQLGDLYKKAEEYNLAQREKVDTFNRATDSANAEMSLKAQQLNSALLNGKYDRDLKRGIYAAQLKMAEDDAWSKAMASSMTSLFDNLGAIGKERLDREDAVATILGQAKNLTPELQEWAAKRLGLRKNGGRIRTKTKRNRRFTL